MRGDEVICEHEPPCVTLDEHVERSPRGRRLKAKPEALAARGRGADALLAPERPTYNHTRADGPYDPCPICVELMSREALLALAKDRREPADVEDLRRDNAELRTAVTSLTEQAEIGEANTKVSRDTLVKVLALIDPKESSTSERQATLRDARVVVEQLTASIAPE